MDFDEDFEAYRPELLDLAHKWIGAGEAEDAVQDAILDYLTTPAVTGKGLFADLSLSLSTVCNVLRRQKRCMPEVHLEDWSAVPEVSDVKHLELSAVARERWGTARLTRCQRAAMSLHLEGLSAQEIADRMVTSVRTVWHHLRGAREALGANRVDLAEFRNAEEMFGYCSEVTVYRSPRKAGCGVSEINTRRLK